MYRIFEGNVADANRRWSVIEPVVSDDGHEIYRPFAEGLSKDRAFAIADALNALDQAMEPQEQPVATEPLYAGPGPDPDCVAPGLSGEGRCIEPAVEFGLCTQHLERLSMDPEDGDDG